MIYIVYSVYWMSGDWDRVKEYEDYDTAIKDYNDRVTEFPKMYHAVVQLIEANEAEL